MRCAIEMGAGMAARKLIPEQGCHTASRDISPGRCSIAGLTRVRRARGSPRPRVPAGPRPSHHIPRGGRISIHRFVCRRGTLGELLQSHPLPSLNVPLCPVSGRAPTLHAPRLPHAVSRISCDAREHELVTFLIPLGWYSRGRGGSPAGSRPASAAPTHCQPNDCYESVV